MIDYLSYEDVLEVAVGVLDEVVVTDPGLLASAVVRPQVTVVPDPAAGGRHGVWRRCGPRPGMDRSSPPASIFVRLDERGWDDAPPCVPLLPGDLLRQNRPLPKAALDDPSAARLLRTDQAQPRLLVRVDVEVLLRTGLLISECTGLWSDAIITIGAAPWLHVPVGKLGDERYPPLPPTSTSASRPTASSTSRRRIRCCSRGRTAGPRTGTR